jgi:prepilin-type N-terminal cleavage/methylation domain-containing protein
MKSLSTYSHKPRGFTMIEVLIVIGLISVLAGMGLMFSFDSYRGYLARSEQTQVVQMLAKSRNRAVNNFDQDQHGLKITDESVVMFSGNIYDEDDTANEDFPRNDAVVYEGATEIVFDQLSGNLEACDVPPSEDCEIRMTYGGITRKVTVNEFGGIETSID